MVSVPDPKTWRSSVLQSPVSSPGAGAGFGLWTKHPRSQINCSKFIISGLAMTAYDRYIFRIDLEWLHLIMHQTIGLAGHIGLLIMDGLSG